MEKQSDNPKRKDICKATSLESLKLSMPWKTKKKKKKKKKKPGRLKEKYEN